METVARRVEFIELLAEAGPLPPRDIVDALPHSRATVTRALRELREANFIEKQDGDYGPTLAGVMAADQYRRYERASEAVLSADSLLEPIPGEHAPPVEVLVDAKTILAEGDIPVRALETVSDRVRRADAVEVYLPTLVNTHLLRVWHRAVLAGSLESTGLFDSDLLTVLKGQYPHLLAEMATAEGFSAHATAGPPYGLVLTTFEGRTSVAVIVYEDDTKLRGVLTNDAPAAVEWVADRLETLRTESTAVTADLGALSDAVADGVAPLRPPPAGSIRTGNTGETTTAAAAQGHDLPIDLEAEGLVRLSEDYFESHGLADPTVSWRTGFTLAEVQGGHSVDRLDAEGRNLTDRLVEALKTGTDHVVLGPPGSGKSTVCMAVACEWYDRRLGPVLYRERGDGDRFESTALLEAYLRQTEGHALVIIEDAVRDDANRIFEVMQSLDAEPSVTFLLDARTHEWWEAEVVDIDARRDAYRRAAVDWLEVPDLDGRECERFVDHFADLVGADLNLSGSELFAMIEEGTGAGDVAGLSAGDTLVAQYHLARHHNPPVDADASAVTALDDDARRTYERLSQHRSPYVADLAVLVAVLTAAGVPVATEFLFAAAEPDEYAAVDEAISRLTGELLFEPDRPGEGSPTTYRTRHETWATRFLAQVLVLEPVEVAKDRVGGAVTRLLALADEADRRDRIQQHLGGRTPHLHRIEADPQRWADELAERLFDVGLTAAELAPLFGETTDDALELPDACSAWTRLQQAYWRGEMNRTHGDLARAEREFRTLEELAETIDLPADSTQEPTSPEFAGSNEGIADDVTTHRRRWRATSRTNLGTVARDRGEYETAEEYYLEALAFFREINDREGEALSFKNLGGIAYLQSDYDQAREYLEQSLDIVRELDARTIEARCLNNLGILAQDRNQYDTARKYHNQSLDIKRDLGNRQGEANSLDNLGLAVQRQGQYELAREYHKRSLEIKRELGDRKGEATSLNNLGRIARREGDVDLAREYFERSLDIRRELGDSRGEAHSLNDLGEVARHRGEYTVASEYLEGALELFEGIGSEFGMALSRLTIGRLALARGEVDRAREHARQAGSAFKELGASHWVGRSHHLLGHVAAADGAPDQAHEHWRTALETFESLTTPQDALVSLEALVEACRERGDEAGAREWCQRAWELLEDAPESTADNHRDWVERHAAELGIA